MKVNPHLQVLCPTLANGGICHRGGKHPKDWLRPKPETVILAQDVLIASGYADGEEDLLHLASGINQ